MIFQDTYRNKKVFLTGHTGFKGSWLLSWLHLLGAEVRGYSLKPDPEHKLYDSIQGNDLCDSRLDDILHYPALEKSISDFKPDFIFHLAAQAIVRTSYEAPVDTFSVNAIGTANLLNAIRKLSKPCVVIVVTTDKVYYNREWCHPYRESDRLGGFDPYSASKACAELIIDSFRNSYFNRERFHDHQKSIVVARAGNVIGGGDWAKDRIIPDVVRALQRGEPVGLRNPSSVRPWQHALEPIHGYLTLGEKLAAGPGQFSNEYNFGPLLTECWPVKKMVEAAINAWGSGSYQTVKDVKKVHEAGLLKLDVSRAEAELGWKPIYGAMEAIERTVSWYKNDNGKNAYELIKNDIEAFSNAHLRLDSN